MLWGDYFYVNTGENFAEGETAGPRRGRSPTNPQTSAAGPVHLLRPLRRLDAADNREPLATNFAARYVTGGAFTGGTSYVVWRDSKVNQSAFTCPATRVRPAWYPLGQEGIVIFDEQENP